MSDPLRVMTSHFSGVVTIICVSSISRFVSCMSPVSSRTFRPAWDDIEAVCREPTYVASCCMLLHVCTLRMTSSQLSHRHITTGAQRIGWRTKRRQPLCKGGSDLCCQSLHGRHVHNLEVVRLQQDVCMCQRNEQLVHHLLSGAQHTAGLAICTASAQRAAGMGWLAWMMPSFMLAAISCSTVSIAMLVLPAPVGAHTRMFSLLLNAFSKMVL